MDLGCLKGRAAPPAGENDANNRRSFVSKHKSNLSAAGSDSTTLRLILQAATSAPCSALGRANILIEATPPFTAECKGICFGEKSAICRVFFIAHRCGAVSGGAGVRYSWEATEDSWGIHAVRSNGPLKGSRFMPLTRGEAVGYDVLDGVRVHDEEWPANCAMPNQQGRTC